MGISNKPQVNFSGGELSPKVGGRIDSTAYFSGAKTLENVICSHYGSAFKTPGTRFVARTKYQDKKSRLIPFVFSEGDSYILEFGDLYIRFFTKEGSVVKSSINIAGISKASEAVVTVTGISPANGAAVDISGVIGMTEVNDKRYLVSDRTSTTFKIKDEDGNYINSSGFTDWSSGGIIEEVYEVVTPWDEDDIADLKFTQEADVVYFAHPDFELRKLSRFAATNWTLGTITYDTLLLPPFLDINTTATTITPSGTTGSITLAASASIFTANHVGSYWKIDAGYAKVTAYTSGTAVTATVIKTVVASATEDWYEGAWSAEQGYPSDCKLFEQRLYCSATTKKPLTVWASVVGDYENFDYGDGSDTDAISFRIGSSQVDRILWLYPSMVMNLGTAGGPFTVSAVGDSIITATNVSVKQQNESGAASVSPVRIGPYVYYVSRSGTVVGRIAYDLNTDSYITDNITYLNDHILEGVVKEMALQQFPYNILWCLREDGVIATMTRVDDQNVKGWTRQLCTNGTFESVASIPNGAEDAVWVITKRDIDGTERYFVEYFETHEFGDQEDAFFVQCGLSYSGTAKSTFGGLDHLEGESVDILADGAVHPSKTVRSGSISLNYTASDIHVGLGYTSVIKTMNLEYATTEGTSQGKPMYIGKVFVRLYKSLGFKYGDGTLEDSAYFGPPPMDSATPLFTGDKEVQFQAGHRLERTIVIKQEQPLPCHVLGIFPKMITG